MELALARSPKVVVSFKAGNLRGYGFPEDTGLDEYLDYHNEALASILDEDGQISFLRDMGINHHVNSTFGSWEGVEPTLVVSLPAESMRTAGMVANVMGHALLQDAAITGKPTWDGEKFGVRIKKKDGSEYGKDEILSALDTVNKEKSAEGLNFSVSEDLKGLEFLDNAYWDLGENYTEDHLKDFSNKIKDLIGEDFEFNFFAQEGDYYDTSGESEADLREFWDKGGITGRPDLQERAIDKLYSPVWEVYSRWINKLQHEPERKKSPLGQEIIQEEVFEQTRLKGVKTTREPTKKVARQVSGQIKDKELRELREEFIRTARTARAAFKAGEKGIEEQRKRIKSLLGRIEQGKETREINRLKKSILRELKTTKPRKGKGKYTADVQNDLNAFREAIRMTEEQALDKISENLEKYIDKDMPDAVAIENRILDILIPPVQKGPSFDTATDEDMEDNSKTRKKFRTMLRKGKLDEREIEIDTQVDQVHNMQILGPVGMDEMGMNMQDIFSSILPKKNKTRKMKVCDALIALEKEEAEKLVDMDAVVKDAVLRTENSGIAFIDEIDKVASRGSKGGGSGPDV